MGENEGSEAHNHMLGA